jgi:hypothetical protein
VNKNLNAVIVEVSGGNVRNCHVNLRGTFGLFPDDCLGGSNKSSSARAITLKIGSQSVVTDIDKSKAIFRERGAIRRFFENEKIGRGDLILIERLKGRAFQISKY